MLDAGEFRNGDFTSGITGRITQELAAEVRNRVVKKMRGSTSNVANDGVIAKSVKGESTRFVGLGNELVTACDGRGRDDGESTTPA